MDKRDASATCSGSYAGRVSSPVGSENNARMRSVTRCGTSSIGTGTRSSGVGQPSQGEDIQDISIRCLSKFAESRVRDNAERWERTLIKNKCNLPTSSGFSGICLHT